MNNDLRLSKREKFILSVARFFVGIVLFAIFVKILFV